MADDITKQVDPTKEALIGAMNRFGELGDESVEFLTGHTREEILQLPTDQRADVLRSLTIAAPPSPREIKNQMVDKIAPRAQEREVGAPPQRRTKER